MTTEERLEFLERELARAKRRGRVLVVAAVVLLAFFCHVDVIGTAEAKDPAKTAAPREIKASAFTVVDKNGVARASMGIENDVPVLSLRDGMGVPRISLQVKDAGPGISLNDASGMSRASIIFTSGVSMFDFSGEDGASLMKLSSSRDGSMLAFSEGGEPLVKLTSGQYGTALGFSGKGRGLRVSLGIVNEIGTLALFDLYNQPRVVLPQ